MNLIEHVEHRSVKTWPIAILIDRFPELSKKSIDIR
jgi:hypothetical protein